MLRQAQVKGLQISLRAALGAALSIAVAQLFRLDHPLYAMLAAVIVTELSPQETRRLSVRRLVATVVGAGCGALFVMVVRADPWTIGLGILVAMLLCSFTRMPEGARVAGYICAIVMMTHGADPWRYAFFRFVETFIGIVVAGLISFVPKLIRIETPDGAGS